MVVHGYGCSCRCLDCRMLKSPFQDFHVVSFYYLFSVLLHNPVSLFFWVFVLAHIALGYIRFSVKYIKTKSSSKSKVNR